MRNNYFRYSEKISTSNYGPHAEFGDSENPTHHRHTLPNKQHHQTIHHPKSRDTYSTKPHKLEFKTDIYDEVDTDLPDAEKPETNPASQVELIKAILPQIPSSLPTYFTKFGNKHYNDIPASECICCQRPWPGTTH
jgi:hypothetical protein